MRSWPNTQSITTSVETACAAGEEKVVATIPGLSTQAPGGKVIFDGSIQAALGAGAASVVLRIRRGGLAGTAVATSASINVTASTTVALPVNGEDEPGEVAGQGYVLTAQPTGGTLTNKFTELNVSF